MGTSATALALALAALLLACANVAVVVTAQETERIQGVDLGNPSVLVAGVDLIPRRFMRGFGEASGRVVGEIDQVFTARDASASPMSIHERTATRCSHSDIQSSAQCAQ